MPSQTRENRRSNSHAGLIIGIAALGGMLVPLSAGSQQTTTPPPKPAPAVNTARVPALAAPNNANQRVPAATTNTQRTPAGTGVNGNAVNGTGVNGTNVNGTGVNGQRAALPAAAGGANRPPGLAGFLSSITHGGNNATAASQPAANNATARSAATNNGALVKTLGTTNATNNSTNPTRLASVINNQPTGRPVQSKTFVGHPGPPGSVETQNRNGDIVRKSADGAVIDVHSPKNGMLIHHGLDGSRRIVVDRPDHTRIVATSRGIQYVQHPYTFGGRSFDHRTFYVQGHVSHQLYRPYTYAGTSLDVYAPPRFYEPKLYQWATSRFNAPQPYNWGYTSNPPPWFAYYKGYFTPEPSYTNPTLWLTDFLLASSLERHYSTEQPEAGTALGDGSPAITPQVKQLLSDEVGRQVKQESVEAQENAQHRDLPPGAGSVVQELGDRQPHVFVVAADLDLVDPTGRRCMISEGDVVQVVSGPQASTSTASAVVLASKGGVECGRAAQVEIAVADLQEMQNHMRETIDQGMANTTAGKNAASVTPAYAASAPAPDADAAREIDQQQQIAAAADG